MLAALAVERLREDEQQANVPEIREESADIPR